MVRDPKRLLHIKTFLLVVIDQYYLLLLKTNDEQKKVIVIGTMRRRVTLSNVVEAFRNPMSTHIFFPTRPPP